MIADTETPQEAATEDAEAIQIITVIVNGQTYLLKPLALYKLVKPLIAMLLSGNVGNGESAEQKNVAMLFKAGVKGIFVAGGPMLLNLIYGTRDHPKPGKKDDVLAWYADILTIFAIKQITNRRVQVETVETAEGHHEIVGYTTEPV